MKKARHTDGFLDTPDPVPLDKARGAGEQILARLRDAILHMQIPPGALIAEAAVGRRYAASRTPVREALSRLREDGLVITLASRGNFVTRLSEARIREARFIREAIELAAVDHLCREGIADDFADRLIDTLKKQRDNVDDDGASVFHALDDQFHLELARATGFDRMVRLLGQEKMVLDRLRVLSLADHVHRRKILDQHAGILEAILKRDGNTARALMEAHLNVILETLAQVCARHGDYFE